MRSRAGTVVRGALAGLVLGPIAGLILAVTLLAFQSTPNGPQAVLSGAYSGIATYFILAGGLVVGLVVGPVAGAIAAARQSRR